MEIQMLTVKYLMKTFVIISIFSSVIVVRGLSDDDCRRIDGSLRLHTRKDKTQGCCIPKNCTAGLRPQLCAEPTSREILCTACPAGQFNGGIISSLRMELEEDCFNHFKCKPGQKMLQDASSTSQRKCICNLGEGYFSDEPDKINADHCTQKNCPAGKELTSSGDCDTCKRNHFKNSTGYGDRCLPCTPTSVCSLSVLSNCTPASDTVCVSPSVPGGDKGTDVEISMGYGLITTPSVLIAPDPTGYAERASFLAIVIGVVCTIVVGVLVGFIMWYCRCRKKLSNAETSTTVPLINTAGDNHVSPENLTDQSSGVNPVTNVSGGIHHIHHYHLDGASNFVVGNIDNSTIGQVLEKPAPLASFESLRVSQYDEPDILNEDQATNNDGTVNENGDDDVFDNLNPSAKPKKKTEMLPIDLRSPRFEANRGSSASSAEDIEVVTVNDKLHTPTIHDGDVDHEDGDPHRDLDRTPSKDIKLPTQCTEGENTDLKHPMSLRNGDIETSPVVAVVPASELGINMHAGDHVGGAEAGQQTTVLVMDT